MRLRSLFIQETGPRPPAGKIEARLSRIPSYELTPEAERCLYAIGRNLLEYTKDPALRMDHLDEAVMTAEVLLKIVTELRSRNEL